MKVWKMRILPKMCPESMAIQSKANKDGKLNDEPGANDGGEENCFVYIFQTPKRHVNNATDKQENFS